MGNCSVDHDNSTSRKKRRWRYAILSFCIDRSGIYLNEISERINNRINVEDLLTNVYSVQALDCVQTALPVIEGLVDIPSATEVPHLDTGKN